ncbi:MAG: PEP-CTERM sorting domain-containing protein [Acidobacteriaceae bacterium]|nr:PEP-CTERM sorting domain-containing protein [Acidobacteriaceae bacterium]
MSFRISHKIHIPVFVAFTCGWALAPSAQADTIQFGGLTFTLTNTESDGTASASNSALAIIGPNDGSGLPGTTDLTALAPADGTVSFDWDYFSLDAPRQDAAGYLLNGTYTQLGDTSPASGTVQFQVTAGETFGFEANSVDNQGEPGILMISAFSAPGAVTAAPEPGTWALFALGGGAILIGFLRVRRVTVLQES